MSQGKRVLVTGATGFIGRGLCQTLQQRGYRARAALRNFNADVHEYAGEQTIVGALGPDTNWQMALEGVDAIVHLAARVHILRERAVNPVAEFRLVNVAGTERLARMAASAGVRRLVYVSSIKVNGEGTRETRFTEDDVPDPQDAYAFSKWEAEKALLKISEETGLEVVIVRPPLVYGPGVGGNFLRIMAWLDRGLPMPLASIRNSRSLIYLGNLVDALLACVEHADASRKVFLVSDGQDVSTPELIRRLAQAMRRRPRLFPFPVVLFRLAGLLTGKSGDFDRLTGSLQVDSSRICREFQWRAPFSLDQGLRETANWFIKTTD